MKKRHWVVGLFIAASLAAGGCSSPTQQAKEAPGDDDELVEAGTAARQHSASAIYLWRLPLFWLRRRKKRRCR